MPLGVGVSVERNVEKALKNLENEFLIYWSRELTVCVIHRNDNRIVKDVKYDNYDEEIVDYKMDSSTSREFREATDEEKKFIIQTERKVAKELLCKFNCKINKQNIIKFGLWYDFDNKVNQELLNKYNIAFYYKSYKVICNEDEIYKKWEELSDLELQKEQRKNEKTKLNKEVVNKLNDNASKRYDRAKDKTKNMFGKIKDDKLERRISDNYIDNNNRLSDTLIDENANVIKDKVKKVKVNYN